jgi:hypothetical protein
MIVLFVMPAVIKLHAPLILMIYISSLIAANDSFIYYWNLSYEEIQIVFGDSHIYEQSFENMYICICIQLYIYIHLHLCVHYSLQLWYRNVLIICEYNNMIRCGKKFFHIFVSLSSGTGFRTHCGCFYFPLLLVRFSLVNRKKN